MYMLCSTKTAFTLTPLPMPPSAETEEIIKSRAHFNLQTPKSLIIDKSTMKIIESDKVYSQEQHLWVREVLGVLGILNIMGVEHLVVVSGRGEVCRLPHKY